MKSICTGVFIARTRSQKKMTLPLSTETASGTLPSKRLSSHAAAFFT